MKHFKDNIIKKNIDCNSKYLQDDKNDTYDLKNENEFYNDLFNEIDENIKKDC